MALDIASFLEISKNPLMFLEAPVGTGKSLGSLVPSLIDIKLDEFPNKSIIYATNTINLQGQLENEELPALRKLGLTDKFIIAKGRSHYFCNKNYRKLKKYFSDNQKSAIASFYEKTNTGHRSELENKYKLDIDDSLWRKIELTDSPSECKKCSYFDYCPTIKHRSKFKKRNNKITVTNHDQLIVSYLNSLDEEDIFSKPIFPVNPGILIVDEAHHFLENFIGRLENKFSLSNLKRLGRKIKLKNEEYKWNVELEIIESWTRKICKTTEGSGKYSIPKDLYSSFEVIANIITGYSLHAKGNYGMELSNWEDTLRRLVKDSSFTHYFDSEGIEFVSIPNTFKDSFENLLRSMTENNKVIFMSGTLTVSGSFKSLFNQWGIDEKLVDTKSYKSPFDFKNQAMIFIPNNISPSNKQDYINKSPVIIKKLLDLTLGRTLLLSTSKDHMSFFRDTVANMLAEMKISLFFQGESGVEKLTKTFKNDETSVLIGSGSYFSGFSVKGTALTSVILNRLPFPVKDDPVLGLLGRGLSKDEYYELITFPTMVNKLNQALGRLIRSVDDYGIFTILDSRVLTNYQYKVKSLIESQDYLITSSWEDVVNFYEIKLKSGANAQYESYDRSNLLINSNLRNRIHYNNNRISLTNRIINFPLMENEIKEDKKIKRLKPKQKSFLVKYCNDSGLNTQSIITKIKGGPEKAYKNVYKWAKENWLELDKLKEDFPYTDEDERSSLDCFDDGDRKVFFPSCSSFLCDGTCSEKNHENIRKHFHNQYNEKIKLMNTSQGLCRITCDNLEVFRKDEFRPSFSKLNKSV